MAHKALLHYPLVHYGHLECVAHFDVRVDLSLYNVDVGDSAGDFFVRVFAGRLELLDVPIVRATKAMVAYLSGHKSLRNFVLNHF